MLLDPKILRKLPVIESTYAKLRFASVSTIDMEMAETLDHYRSTPPKDAPLEWRPVKSGDRWGDNWSNAWFRGRVEIPESVNGKAPFLKAGTGGKETQLIVEGRHYGVFDGNHPVRLLTTCATCKSLEIFLESYSGHSFPGTQPYDQPLEVVGGATQDSGVTVTKGCHVFGSVELVVEREDVSAFVFELRALRQLAESIEPNSLRRGRIHAVFAEVYRAVYAKPEEVEEDLWRTALLQAREIMRPLLDLKNGPTAPFMGIIGHSHIDTAWLWPISETHRKLARTFSSVLSLMDQYPDFRFTSSAAYHADVIRKMYPEIFERMQARVKEGRWEINGAMWVEPDCNIPSGESFVRQSLLGQRATREMFRVTSDTLWQPDVFGYSAALPQILRGSGVEFFCTTKLGWNDTTRFPYDTFVWEGIDGSSVISHFNRIHCEPDPETLIQSWKEVQHNDVQDRRLIAFGWGDGGGGPTAEMIEIARLVKDLEGCPRSEYTSISEFMTGLRDNLPNLPRWKGELYLELHRGTLTSIAKIKRYNRKCEFALRDAELAATIATLQAGTPYPHDELTSIWKQVLVNQFHDILPGSSIARVNDEAIALFETCLNETVSVTGNALNSIANEADSDGAKNSGVMLANSLSWPRKGEFDITGMSAGLQPHIDGAIAQEFVDLDNTHKTAVSGIELPALGFRSFPLMPIQHRPSPFVVSNDRVETPFAHIKFDDAGRIMSFYVLKSERELVTDGGAFNAFIMGEDVPAAWDNWDIDRDQSIKMRPQTNLMSRTIESDGPLQLRIRRTYRIGLKSTLTQDIIFHSSMPQVDFDTKVDWQDKHQFLKVAFSLNVNADSARHEIQFGHVIRSTHDNILNDRAQFDVCAHKWTDISETDFGVAFLNDSKYACTTKHGEYILSLLKSGRHPDPRGDEGTHRFAYSILPHLGGFSVESVIRPAYEFNLAPVSSAANVVNTSFSLLSVEKPNIIVESIKWAEDEDAFIVRLYEAGRTATHTSIHFGVPVTEVAETNLLEETQSKLNVTDNSVDLHLRAFEIKTLKVKKP